MTGRERAARRVVEIMIARGEVDASRRELQVFEVLSRMKPALPSATDRMQPLPTGEAMKRCDWNKVNAALAAVNAAQASGSRVIGPMAATRPSRMTAGAVAPAPAAQVESHEAFMSRTYTAVAKQLGYPSQDLATWMTAPSDPASSGIDYPSHALVASASDPAEAEHRQFMASQFPALRPASPDRRVRIRHCS